MLGAIARFEIKYHLRAPLFYILLLVFSLLTFFAVTSDAVQIGGSIGNVHRNAPYVVMQILLVMSIFGVLTTTAFVANAIHRDFELGTDALFFSTPIRKWQFIGGRFLGAFSIAVLVYVGVSATILLGSFMPWLDKEQLGPFQLWPYVFSLFAIIIPNLLLAGAIFFSIAALTRSMMATYASVVGFFVLYVIASVLLTDVVENEQLGGLLDPFGLGAFDLATRYWTVFDKNTKVLSLDGVYLWNRVLWVGIAMLILAFTFWKFQFTTGSVGRRAFARRRSLAAPEPAASIHRIALEMPRVSQAFGGSASFAQFRGALRMEALGVFKSIPFAIMLLFGVINVWGGTSGGGLFGTPMYPVTAGMVEVIWGNFSLFGLLIATFFAGDMVWRERTLKLNEVYDAMPMPTWVQWSAKLTSLLLIVLVSLVTAVATTIIIQAANGYTNFEPAVYVEGVFLQVGSRFLLVTAFAFLMQVFFNQKFVGFLGMMLWFVMNLALPRLDYEHLLYRFAAVPPFRYSDMNGYGHFVAPLLWTTSYWILFVAIALAIAHLFWVRGTGEGLRQRLQVARQRFHARTAITLGVLFVAFASAGGYVYYNTNILNPYRTSDQNEERSAMAEKKYKKYQGAPQPRIVDVKADVDIHPERRAVFIRGTYTAVNKSTVPIRDLHVTYASSLTSWKFDIPGARIAANDPELGYTRYRLDRPLQPGQAMTMRFATSFEAKGFVNGESNTDVVENGTFINNFEYFPHFGYSERVELEDRNRRKELGLPPLERMKKPDDLKARMEHQLARGTDWLSLDTTVSTSADQVALAPGYLQREWTSNGRRFFHYKTTSPILGFWSYLSARYTVKRDRWKDVPIEIYYDAKHPYNVDRMIDGVKKSLDYFTQNFSPYQHEQVRILEFPRYATFAQSFPNTIPYSESIGFIADLRDEDELDYVFYVTAHEIAHQWWAHQVIGGNVQGATMLTETMAQYSALMVMEKEYGKEKMQKFLRYELDRYLRDRGGELIAEMPLALVERQSYIHYRKGSLAMYALRDAVGEERVNRALAKFIRDHAFSGPPYPTATELVQYFRAEAPPEAQRLITDLFERIVLYDLQTKEASVTKRADGKYVVKITVAASKFESDDKGKDEKIAVDDWVDIGVLGSSGRKKPFFKIFRKTVRDDKVLFVEKRRITKPVEMFEVVVNEPPTSAGIDVFNKLIDRNPKDNTKSL